MAGLEGGSEAEEAEELELESARGNFARDRACSPRRPGGGGRGGHLGASPGGREGG